MVFLCYSFYMKLKQIGQLAAWIFGCNLVGIFGSFFTASSLGSWYITLEKPVFSPPNWLFGPVWTLLYTLMGISAFLIIQKGWKKKEIRKAMGVFGIQLLLNAVWTPIFFGARRIDLALVVLVLLFVCILWTIILFYRQKRMAAYLLLPYLAWVGFAGVLNASVWFLN